MNYVKSCLIITMLLGGLYADCDTELYNCDCNQDTWQEYYNSEGHNMEGCWLPGAILYQAYLSDVNLSYANLEHAELCSYLLGL